MRFGDVVTVVASLAVVLVLISFPLNTVLGPALADWPYIPSAIYYLLTTLIGGYIFAGKIWEEDRMKIIAQITVLAAVLMVFYVISFPALPHWGQTVEKAYEDMPEAATWPPSEWLAVEQRVLGQVMFINVVMVLILGFIGLYIGSMLRRPSGK